MGAGVDKQSQASWVRALVWRSPWQLEPRRGWCVCFFPLYVCAVQSLTSKKKSILRVFVYLCLISLANVPINSFLEIKWAGDKPSESNFFSPKMENKKQKTEHIHIQTMLCRLILCSSLFFSKQTLHERM